jgi:TolA-binding protein
MESMSSITSPALGHVLVATGNMATKSASSTVPAKAPASSARGNSGRLSALLARQVRREADRLRELGRLEAEDQQLQEKIERLRRGS